MTLGVFRITSAFTSILGLVVVLMAPLRAVATLKLVATFGQEALRTCGVLAKTIPMGTAALGAVVADPPHGPWGRSPPFVEAAALPSGAHGLPFPPAMGKSAVSLKVHDVHKSFDRDAVKTLQGVHVQVDEGERHIIMVPTGCDKLTLLALMSLLAHPDSGTIAVAAMDSRTISSPERWRATDLASVFYLHYLLPHVTVQENLALALRPHRLPRTTAAERVSSLLQRLQLFYCAIPKLATSPQGKGHGLPWRGPWSTARGSSSPTNLREAWTPKPESGSSTSCLGGGCRRDPHWWWSLMTRG